MRTTESVRIRQYPWFRPLVGGGVFSGRDYGISEEEPTLVADVCTNSDTGKVLHEGVGRFNPIIIAYGQPDGTVLAGVGYMMSYYEFEEENFTKVSDSEWRKRGRLGHCRPDHSGLSFLYPPAEWITHLKGDLNDDGNVTAADAAIALELAVRGEWHADADMSGDCQVTSLDALIPASGKPWGMTSAPATSNGVFCRVPTKKEYLRASSAIFITDELNGRIVHGAPRTFYRSKRTM